MTATLAQLKSAVSAAARRSEQLPADQAAVVVRASLLHGLRGRSVAQARELLQRLAAETHQVSGDAGESAASDAVLAHMRQWVARYYGEERAAASPAALIALLDTAFAEMSERLNQLSGHRSLMTEPLQVRLERASENAAVGDDAMRSAAQESFDRLLGALDPESAQAYANEGKLKVGPFHKAAMYQAVVEKFSQIKSYHEKGRLVRDFRAMYRSHLKKRQRAGQDN